MIPFPNGRPRQERHSVLPYASRADLAVMWMAVGLCAVTFAGAGVGLWLLLSELFS